jgi:hypothetical protein
VTGFPAPTLRYTNYRRVLFMGDSKSAASGDSSHHPGRPASPSTLELIIERAEATGEGATEGLTLHVKGFPDSAAIGAYFAHGGIKTVPSEPGERHPQWWDLFFAGADAGIAYAPEGGVSKIEIESSEALARGLPLTTIEGRRVYLGGIPDLKSVRGHLPAGYSVKAPTADGPSSKIDLVLGGKTIGSACQPDAGDPGRMAFEFEDAGTAEAFHRQALAHGYVGAATGDIAALVNRYVTRHHRAAHEASHVTRNALIVVGAIAAAVALVIAANAMSGGKISKSAHRASVKIGITKEPRPAYIVGDTGALVTAGNVVGIGTVYLEFPERAVQAGDTVAVRIPAISTGDRVYTAATTRPDSSGHIVQIIVARITDEKGNPRYEHPLGALPVPSYKLPPQDQWGPTTDLDSLGAGYVQALEARLESSKRIRVTGVLAQVTDESGTRYVITSGPHSIVLGGPVDGLTAVRLGQLRDKQVDLTGNILRILAGAYRNGKPAGLPMLEVNPVAVMQVVQR